MNVNDPRKFEVHVNGKKASVLSVMAARKRADFYKGFTNDVMLVNAETGAEFRWWMPHP